MKHLTLIKPSQAPRPSLPEIIKRFAEIHERMLKDVAAYKAIREGE